MYIQCVTLFINNNFHYSPGSRLSQSRKLHGFLELLKHKANLPDGNGVILHSNVSVNLSIPTGRIRRKRKTA